MESVDCLYNRAYLFFLELKGNNFKFWFKAAPMNVPQIAAFDTIGVIRILFSQKDEVTPILDLFIDLFSPCLSLRLLLFRAGRADTDQDMSNPHSFRPFEFIDILLIVRR